MKDDNNKTLNELVDDILGDCRPSKNAPPLSRHMEDDFNKFFADMLKKPYSPIKKETLVVNLFAGPGTGKSTTCAGIFFDLKNLQIDCEMALEFAKDLVWENRHATFEDQIYLFAKQYHRIFRLLGKIDVVITDCPILLSPVYDTEKRPTFEKLVREEHDKMWNYNVFLKRKKSYNPIGRIHNKSQALEIDRKVLDVLDRNNQSYEIFEANTEGKNSIVKKILLFLDSKYSTLKK